MIGNRMNPNAGTDVRSDVRNEAVRRLPGRGRSDYDRTIISTPNAKNRATNAPVRIFAALFIGFPPHRDVRRTVTARLV